MIQPLTAANRRAHTCPTCGQGFGALQEDLSMVCAAVISGWRGQGDGLRAETQAGCGLRLYLCRAHGLRTRREGDTRCRCAEAAQPARLSIAA